MTVECHTASSDASVCSEDLCGPLSASCWVLESCTMWLLGIGERTVCWRNVMCGVIEGQLRLALLPLIYDAFYYHRSNHRIWLTGKGVAAM
jgi:hypothetical protein